MIRNTLIVTGATAMVIINIYICYNILSNKEHQVISVTAASNGNSLIETTDSHRKHAQVECDRLLNETIYFRPPSDEHRFQLISAAPGSGSDWCRITIPLLSGFKVASAYELPRTELEELTQKVSNIQSYFYYKTHYPIYTYCKSCDQIAVSAQRVVLLIRHPVEAAFSERLRKYVQERSDIKYGKYGRNLSEIIASEDFIRDRDKPSYRMEKEMKSYFYNWRKHAVYWLTQYTGSLKVILYRDLVKDLNTFKDILGYFGVDPGTQQSIHRFKCLSSNANRMTDMRRPAIKEIEAARQVVLSAYEQECRQHTEYIESLIANRTGVRVRSSCVGGIEKTRLAEGATCCNQLTIRSVGGSLRPPENQI